MEIIFPLWVHLMAPNSIFKARIVSPKKIYSNLSVAGSAWDSSVALENLGLAGVVGWSGVVGCFGDSASRSDFGRFDGMDVRDTGLGLLLPVLEGSTCSIFSAAVDLLFTFAS